MKRPKISIIGGGFVGGTTAHFLACHELGDIVVLDRNEGIPQGKALDLSQAGPIEQFDAKITGTNSYEDTANSDIVIITAGIPRKPDMSRDELRVTNANIVREVSERIKETSPNAIVIVVSNPLDAMVHVAFKVTGFPPARVCGMAGILDSSRMRSFLAEALNISVEDTHALVLGGHGDTMVPLTRYANVNGIPIRSLLPPEKISSIVERTKNGGAEIVNLLKTGSAYSAPAAAISEMVEAIVKDKKRVLPCAAYLNGEYGVQGLFIGVPVVLGAKGVERIIEIEFNEEEQKDFQKTVDHVQALVTETEKILSR